MKLIEIVNSVEALNELLATKLPATVAFNLNKFIKEITADVEFYNKIKNEKVMEYGTPVLDEDGKPTDKFSFSIPGSTELTENGKKFIEEMNEVENKELEVSIPEIKISDLGNSKIEPKNLSILSWLIKE